MNKLLPSTRLAGAALAGLLLVGGCSAGDSSSTPSPTTAPATTPTTAPATTVPPAGPAARDLTVTTPDGRTRTAHLYVPASLPVDAPVPLLVALHGGYGHRSPVRAARAGSTSSRTANRFLVVYPDGIGSRRGEDQLRTWNGGVCCGAAVNSPSTT